MKLFLSGSFLGGIIGGLVGALLIGYIQADIFRQQRLSTQFALFIDEMDKVHTYAKPFKEGKLSPASKIALDLSLNKAWSKAFVLLPDEIFFEVAEMFKRPSIGKKTRNRIYFNLRKHLYPDTKVDFDQYMDTFIELKVPKLNPTSQPIIPNK